MVIILFITNGAIYSKTKSRQDFSPVDLGKQLKQLNPNKDYVIILDPDALQRNQALFYANTQGWHIQKTLPIQVLVKYD